MGTYSRPLESDPPMDSEQPLILVSQTKFESILGSLLMQYRDSDRTGQEDVARYARTAVAALLAELRAEGSDLAAPHPAKGGRPITVAPQNSHVDGKILRRPLGTFGATEGQWSRTRSPSTWGAELVAAGFNPCDELTPG